MRRFDPGKAASIALVLSAIACGGDGDGERSCNDGGSGNTLTGSYCEDVSMSFTEVRFLTVSGAVRIEYVRPVGTGSEKALQIILDGSRYVLEPDKKIPLLDAGAEVRRIVVDAPAAQTLTGELEATSSITFSEYSGAVGSPIAGKFALLFKSGRTLSGDFEGVLEDARPTAGALRPAVSSTGP